MRKLFVLIILLFIAGPGWGVTYYVDSTCGSPGDGTSSTCSGATAPWNQLSDVTGLNNADTLYLIDGSIFREALTIPAAITIAAYPGSGTKPIVSAFDLASGWTGPDAYDTYYIACSTQTRIVLVDGILADRDNDAYASGSVDDGKWKWSSNVLYFNPAGSPGTDPDLSTIQYGQRDFCLYMDGNTTDGVTINGIEFNGGNDYQSGDAGLYFLNCDYITITNNTFKYSWGALVQFFGNTGSMDNLTVTNNVFEYSYGSALNISTSATAIRTSNVNFSNNMISYVHWKDWDTRGQGSVDGEAVTIRGCSANCIISNNEISTIGHALASSNFHGIVAYECDDTDIYGNYVYDITHPEGFIKYDGQTGNFTVSQTLTGGTSGATATIVADYDSGATGTLIISGITGIFKNNETITDEGSGSATANGRDLKDTGAGIWVSTGGAARDDVRIYSNIVANTNLGIKISHPNVSAWSSSGLNVINNTIYNSERANFVFLKTIEAADSAIINLYNNIGIEDDSDATANLIVELRDDVETAFTFDYNFYRRANDAHNIVQWVTDYDGTPSTTNYNRTQLATYQAAKSQDANSSVADPQVISPANDDFTLQITSPAIDAGTWISAIHDSFAGDNPRCKSGYSQKKSTFREPDCGACELGTSNVTNDGNTLSTGTNTIGVPE